jgi:hypothetical protein
VVDEEEGFIALANNDVAMQSVISRGSLEAGQAGLIIIPFSAETVALMGRDGSASSTAAEFVSNLAAGVSTGTPSEVTETTLNDKNFAYVTLFFTTGDDSIAVAVDIGDGYMLLQVITASGELGDFQDTFLAIASTFTFTPASSATSEVTEEATP